MISTALTFGEGFLEAFPVDMSQDVMRLPVEMSECQLTEELIAGKQTRNIKQDNTLQSADYLHTHSVYLQVTNCGICLTITASAASNTRKVFCFFLAQ